VDLFDQDLVIIPINCGNSHWTLALINVRWRRFEYFDSLFGGDGGRLRTLRRYLEDEHKARRGGRGLRAKVGPLGGGNGAGWGG
jgi:sentrin-specific protease 1